MTEQYKVLARKWRPQQFADVIGQEHVTRTLSNAITEDRIAHAYLLVGPRGTGKTTTARIFAKALNCEKGPTPTPCDECDSCREIMAGNSMDVIEIDAASNTGVDNVRELRENARYAPARSTYKIYVIDEVHMLSTGAFNALLKTLEEPPPHVKFVLATTDPQKVPATIHSRCQRFDLRRISTPVIAESIGKIAKAEGIDIDQDALLAIARGAEGGMRDAQSALDQLISFIGNTIREPDVLSVFGLVSRATLEELADAILQGDVHALLRCVAELDAGGKDMQRLMLELIEHFRNLLVCLYAPDSLEALDITGAQHDTLKAQAEQTDAGRVLSVVQLLTESEAQLRYALSRRTLVETTLIRCARAASVASIDTILKQLAELKAALGGSEPTASASLDEPAGAKKKSPDPVTPAPEPPADAPPAEPDLSVEEEETPTEVELPDDVPPAPAPRTPSVSIPDEQLRTDHQRLFAHWHDLIDRAGHGAPLVRNYLLDAKPTNVESDVLTIGFDPEFADGIKNVDVPRNRKVLDKVFSQFLQRPIQIRFKLMQPGETLPADLKFPEGHQRNPEQAAKIPEHALTAEQRWSRDPIVRLTLESFNGEIIDIRE